MYSKYEEMKVIQQLLSNYSQNCKINYEKSVKKVRDYSSQLTSDIEKNTIFGCIQAEVGLMDDYIADYNKSKNILSELSKATMCYEMGYPIEVSDDFVEQRKKEGNKIFYEIRTQNADYKGIMADIAFNMFFRNHDENLDNLIKLGLDNKIEQLEQSFEKGILTKEQLIVYINACMALSTHPEFLEYAAQFDDKKAGIHK